MTRESRPWGRDPRDEKYRGIREKARGRELRSITQDGTTAGVLRERNKEEERKGGNGESEKERTEAATPVG